MTREGPETAEETLRLQWRQVVPFRDGAWSAAGTSLAEHVFVCARQARGCGFRPRSQLIAFYRGLAAVAAAARLLAPDLKRPEHAARPERPARPEHPERPERRERQEDDALLEALKEVRVLTSFSQVRAALSPPWTDQWGRYAALMSELPRKLDELLALAADSDPRTARSPLSPRSPLPPRQEAERPGREESSQLFVAGALLVVGALVLMLHYLEKSGALAGRGEAVAAALFLAVGGTLTWIVARVR
jgi:hypothetical protein